MKSRIDFSTDLTAKSLQELKFIARSNPQSYAHIEIVLRHINDDSGFFSQLFSERDDSEAISICDKQLALTPQHNFFNYALAILERDKSRKCALLAKAALNIQPCGESISAQAAFELAELSYIKPVDQSTNEAFYRSQAWFIRALLLGSQRALHLLYGAGIYHPTSDEACTKEMTPITVHLLLLLFGKKIPVPQNLRYFSSLNDADKSIILTANKSTTSPATQITIEMSPISNLAALVIRESAPIYLNNFLSCGVRIGVIPRNLYISLLHCLLLYTPTDLLRIKQLILKYFSTQEQEVGAVNPSPLYLIPADKLTAEQLRFATPFQGIASGLETQPAATATTPALQMYYAAPEPPQYYPSLQTHSIFVPTLTTIDTSLVPIFTPRQ